MKYKIYKLIYNGEVIYIGKTKNTLKIRFSQKYPKIPIEIKKQSSIELIEETDDISRERFWIKYYIDLGYKLYNILKGDGLDIKEYRENNKEYRIKYLKDWRENNKEYDYNRYHNNIEHIREIRKLYREKNREKIRENDRKNYIKRKLLKNERTINS